jgi:hypothetical protein
VRLDGITHAEVNATHDISNMNSCSAFSVLEGSQPDHSSSQGLKRAIYTGRFLVCSGKAQLHLSTVHIDQGSQKGSLGPGEEISKRLPPLINSMREATAAAAAAAAAASRRGTASVSKKQPFFAVLGDFNRDAGHSCFENLRNPGSEGCGLCPLLAPGVATNYSRNAQYDNVWVPVEQREAWSQAQVLMPCKGVAELSTPQAVSRYSDHLMVYMTFKV